MTVNKRIHQINIILVLIHFITDIHSECPTSQDQTYKYKKIRCNLLFSGIIIFVSCSFLISYLRPFLVSGAQRNRLTLSIQNSILSLNLLYIENILLWYVSLLTSPHLYKSLQHNFSPQEENPNLPAMHAPHYSLSNQ